jgi:5-methylcytosine-specific restriction endonuclease McrA
MSKAWAKGSTHRWRQIRAKVLARDGYRCRLQLEGCTTVASHVHHTLGRAVSGDDPAHLVSACRSCNLAVGDPTRSRDPVPRPRTRW